MVKLGDTCRGDTFLSQIVTRLAFTFRVKNSKPEFSVEHAVLGVRWEVSCVSQEEGTVVKGQVPVGCLVLKRQFQVDHSSPSLFVGTALVLLAVGTTSELFLGRLLVVTRLAHGRCQYGIESSTETLERGGAPRLCQGKKKSKLIQQCNEFI